MWSGDGLIFSVCVFNFFSTQMYLCLFICVCVSVSNSSIWILLIPFSSSNPSFSISSSHTVFALSPPLTLPLYASLIATVCIARGCIFHAVVIHLAAAPDKHVVVDRRLGPGPEEQDEDDRLTWVGPALVPTSAWAATGNGSHLARWSGVELSPLFIKRTSSLCLASPWPPASCHSGTREN